MLSIIFDIDIFDISKKYQINIFDAKAYTKTKPYTDTKTGVSLLIPKNKG